MVRILQARLHSLTVLVLVLLAVPQVANAYVDPGSGTMLWQLAAATAIGSLFYVKRAWMWVRRNIGSSSPMAGGFLFATAFALVATPVTLILCENHPLPRFNDFFLIGIVLTAYLFRWEPSVYLLGISLLVSAWVLPPSGSFQVAGFSDWYRILSFTAVSIILIGVVSRSKVRKTSEERAIGYTMHGAANGAD